MWNGDRSAWRFGGLIIISLSCVTDVSRAGGGEPAFVDATTEANVDAQHAPAASFTLSFVNLATMTGGAAAGDFNNDGWQDLFIVIGGGAPDRLFINNADGTFANRATDWGIDDLHMGIGATVGDYDADGWLDIYVTSLGPAGTPPATGKHRLYHNNGNGTFTNVAMEAGVHMSSTSIPDGMGAAFGDYDVDGDLDLYVTGWVSFSGSNKLFRNNGNGTFTNVTPAAGLIDSGMRGFAPRFVDMNGDRFPELLVAADFSTSRYYRNNGNGTFTNWTTQSGTGLDDNGMGQAVGDFDRDGLLDWYVSSIYTTASELPGVPGTGNMLYHAVGSHSFTEIAASAGVNDGGWGWGTVAVDVNHDGWLDLLETNGWAQTNFGQSEWLKEQSYLWINNGDLTFAEIALGCGLVHTLEGRGMLNFDYDLDGDQDIVIVAYNGPLSLFRNELSRSDQTHWLRVILDTSANPRLAPNGYGARITVTSGKAMQTAPMSPGATYLSQCELAVHFGLGEAVEVDELRVDWPDGTAAIRTNVSANQTLVIVAGSAADFNHDGEVTAPDLAFLLANWGAADSPADLDLSGTVDAGDLAALLAAWGS